MRILLYRFHRINYANFFSPNNYKKNDKIIYEYSNDKYGRKASLEFRFKKIDKTRNYLLDDIELSGLTYIYVYI